MSALVSAIVPQLEAFSTMAWPLRLLAFLLAGAVVGVLGRMTGQNLSGRGVRWGIVSFELAGTAVRAREIVQIWHKRQRLAAARKALYWDFALIPAYVLTLALACALAAPPLAWPLNVQAWDGVLRLAAVLIVVSVLAGVLDVIENLALLRLLGVFGDEAPGTAGSRPSLELWARLAQWCALLKFAGLTIAVFFALSGWAAAAGGLGQAVVGKG